MVIVDDDFQNPISEIVKLLTYATENDFDVTYTYYKRNWYVEAVKAIK